MSLEKSQVQNLLEKRPQRNLLENAVRHQNRLKLHSETQIESARHNPAFDELFGWIKSYLTEDKFNRFIQLLRFPVVSLEITQDIFTEYQRIFDGQNPFFNYEFTNPDLSREFAEYLRKGLSDKEFFKTIGFEQLKYSINSVLVVDIPTEQIGSTPDPYYYFVDASSIIDVDSDKNGTIDHIIFTVNKDTIAVYDKESYKIYKTKGNKIVGDAIIDQPHSLGYCPASYFWNKNLNSNNTIEKKSPLTDVLGTLDKYLAFDTFKEYADLYGTFPIISAYEELCNFEGCQDGFISSEYSIIENGTEVMKTRQTKCQVCSNRVEMGPGSFYEVPAPQSNDHPNLSNPVTITTPDTKSLEYIKNKINEYADKVRSVTIGTTASVLDNQSVNEKQVFGSFESRRNVLLIIASSIETIHKFANDTVARLKYGDQFLSSVVFYGDEFFLKSVNDLMFEYKEAKLNGEPDEEVDQIYRQILETKYKGNDDRIQRAWTLYNLNPEPHKTVTESKQLLSDGAMTFEEFTVKARFSNYIARFERENTNVVDFGRDLEFDKKIDNITQILNSYIVIDDSKAVDNPLRSLVGSLTSVIDISKAVFNGDMTRSSAVSILTKTLGYSLEDSNNIITNQIKNLKNEA